MNVDPTTTAPDRRDLRRGLRDEVKRQLLADPAEAHLLPCWKTSAGSEQDVVWRVSRKSPNPTDKATLASMRRIVVHLPETIIGSRIDLQKGKPEVGASFIPGHDANLCRSGKIPRDQASLELQALGTATDPLGLADSAPMAGGQSYRGRANWSVCSVVDMITGEAPPNLAMLEAMPMLGVSRQTNMQRVNHGSPTAARTSRAKQRTLHISTLHKHSAAFWPNFNSQGVV